MDPKVILLVLVLVSPVSAWSDGYSIMGASVYENWSVMWDEYNYGTHDYLAQKALGFLSGNETSWLNEQEFYYGTELPDSDAREGFADSACCQHIFFNPNGSVRDDIMAWKSMRKYNLTLELLGRGVNDTASKWVGSMTHYIADAGLWGRLVRASAKSRVFEDFIMVRTDLIYPSDDFEDLFSTYISFDGSLEMLSPYEAVMKVANATYFGEDDGSCSAGWMDENYNTSDPEFLRCAGRNFNNIVNAIADVLHTIYMVGFEGAQYVVYPTNWSDARLPVKVTLGGASEYAPGERIAITATPNRKAAGGGWELYSWEADWNLVESANVCGLPLCGEVCNTTNLTICEETPGCSEIGPSQQLTWTWDQGLKEFSTIDCNPLGGSWRKGDECLDSIRVEPGLYKVTFAYDYQCPISPGSTVAEKNFTIRAPVADATNLTISEPKQPEPEPSSGINLDWIIPYLVVIPAIILIPFAIRYTFKFARHRKKLSKRRLSKK